MEEIKFTYYERNKEKVLQKGKEYRKNNKEKVLQKKKEYYENNKEKAKKYREDNKEKAKKYCENNKDKLAQRKKEWRANNKDKVKEYSKGWRTNNKEKIAQREKEYRVNNKDKRFYINMARRQRKKQVNEHLPKNMRTIIYNKFNHQCFNCPSTENLHIDHHYPLSKGFALTITNAVLLCRRCNSSKHAKLPEEFYTKKQLNDLELNYGISKSSFQEKQPSLFKYLKQKMENKKWTQLNGQSLKTKDLES